MKRKITQKLLALLLSIVMVIGLSGNAFAAFKDVSAGDDHAEAIAILEESGIVIGTGNGKFQPNEPMTTAALVTVLGRIAGVSVDQSAVAADVRADGWSGGYMTWAIQNLLIDSGANQHVGLTSAEANAILAKFCALYNIESVTVSAASSIVTRGEAAEAVAPLVGVAEKVDNIPGNAAQYDTASVKLNEESMLQGMNILFLGSSVTYGSASQGISYADYIGKMDGFNVTKATVNDPDLTDEFSHFVAQLNALDTSKKYDGIVVQLSANDTALGKELGEISDSFLSRDFDTNTITGAMEYIIAYAQETWNCPVIFCTGTYFESETYSAMVAQLQKLQAKWSVCVIDLYNDAELNAIDADTYQLYMYDEIHPTKAGYLNWWTPAIETQLSEYMLMFVGVKWYMTSDDATKAAAPGNADKYALETVETNPNSPLNGMNILFLGSSVTYGAAAQGVSFADYIGKMDGVNVTKEAVSATTLVDEYSYYAFVGYGDGRSYVTRLKALDTTKSYDAVVVQLSTNDATMGKELGEISDSFLSKDFDTHTVTGAMEYIIAYAQETWNCPVIFYTGSYYESEAYSAMVDRLLELQAKWSIGVIDLYNDEELNDIDEDTYNFYMYDEIHPTKAGYLEWWTPAIEAQLSEYMQLFVGVKWYMTNDDAAKAAAPGNADKYALETVETNPNSLLNGMNILFLGSSVTYGAAAQGVSFADYIGKMDGVNVTKEAVSATTLVDEYSFYAFVGYGDGRSYVTRLKALDTTKSYDAVVVQLSTNDATMGKELGEISDSFLSKDFDTHTVTGAMEYVIAYVQETWNCPVVFYTGSYYESEAYSAMVDRLLELQAKWSIGVIDLYNDEELNDIDEDTYNFYMYDEIHPTKAGYLEWWTPAIEAQLSEYMQLFVGVKWYMTSDDAAKAAAPGNADEYALETVETNPNSPLNGKNILFLGSSVTYGAAAQGVSFADYIGKMDGVNVTKEAVSATTLVDEYSFYAFVGYGDGRSYVTRLKALDTTKSYDAVVVQLSTNDATMGKELGEISDSFLSKDFDTHTITGAMEYVIAYVKETWNCPVIFYTGSYYESTAYSAMANRLLELQKKWDIGVVDLYNDAELNDIDEDTYNFYMFDEIHPTKAGYLEWWTPVIEAYLSNYLK